MSADRSKRPVMPELVRECREDGKGWRIDEKGDWYPCSKNLGPVASIEEYRAKKAQEAGEA